MCVLEEREKRRMRQKYIDEKNREEKGPDVDHIVCVCMLKRKKSKEGMGTFCHLSQLIVYPRFFLQSFFLLDSVIICFASINWHTLFY